MTIRPGAVILQGQRAHARDGRAATSGAWLCIRRQAAHLNALFVARAGGTVHEEDRLVNRRCGRRHLHAPLDDEIPRHAGSR